MFKKEVVFKCDASAIEQLITKHYPQYVGYKLYGYELYAYEEHDKSVMVVNVYSEDVPVGDRASFGFGNPLFMATTLLNKLAFDGVIEPGKYMIDRKW